MKLKGRIDDFILAFNGNTLCRNDQLFDLVLFSQFCEPV